MAKRMPHYSFVLTDKQAAMVEKAEQRTKGLSNIEFHVKSAEDLKPFPNEYFDAATGCYVLMFVDLAGALTELTRVLKTGGLAFMAVWKDMPFYALPREVHA